MIAASCLALGVGVSHPAKAQVPRDIALDQFEPAPAGDALLAVPDATVAPGIRPSFALMGVYARNPLVLARDGDEREELGKIVTHQLLAHALASLDLFGVAKLHLDVPMTLSQNGESPSFDGSTTPSPDSASFNDLRAGVRFALLDQRDWVPALAAAATAWFPTGDENAFAGADSTRFALSIHAGGDYRDFLWRAAIGRRRHDAGTLEGVLGSDVFFAAGGAARLGPIQLGPELYGSTVAGNGVDAFERSSTNLEAIVSGKARVSDFTFGAGAGPGLTRGIGTPTFRAIVMAEYSPEVDWAAIAEARASKRDEPVLAETPSKSDGAPADVVVQDRDGDGVPDASDVCPTVVGEPEGPKPGCPPDADDDGIVDMDDKCPGEPGVPSTDPAKYGCPPDSDGDGIIDPRDACPRERGPATEDPKTNGCPESVRVEGTQIVIMQKVEFATGKADIAEASDALLTQVARVLEDHPEIARVAVDGHTDNVGLERNNLSLSRRRALSVVRWLVAHGVDERRLEARGFGPRRPIAPNDSDEGRAKNRRVEFQILKRTPLGESGWKDGEVHE